MATIYAFRLSNGSFKVGQTSKDDPYERLEKTFSTGAVLYRFFFVDPERRHTIEGLIHKELAPLRDTRADGTEIFLEDAKDTIDRLFDLWQSDDQQSIVLSAEEKDQLLTFKKIEGSNLDPPIPLDDELAGFLELWRHHKFHAARHQKMMKLWQERIELRIGSASGVLDELSWKSSAYSDVDKKLLKEKYPDIFAECSAVSVRRTLREVNGPQR